ncbi:MAG: RsmE family RNA methyltransferase [Flavihumibacter sp.]|nr:RsmE family RNA methyltransferase [Flavihumibacter sp.]
MALPFFYTTTLSPVNSFLTLNEESSKHIVQVLRMNAGEALQLTDGKGNISQAIVENPHKKSCVVKITANHYQQQPLQNTIAISLTKNTSRFEWFLEKATELGITHIIPLLCERTERSHLRVERMQTILISALLQSQQSWLPVLQEPLPYKTYMQERAAANSFIAHCVDSDKKELQDYLTITNKPAAVCIGPEGDFTPGEIELALSNGWLPVSLGTTRLRTETAGMTAAVLLTHR